MKLKNVLRLSFLTLTLIPIVIVLIMFYRSGYELSKQSYTNNLIESINVQSDYISQTLENNMITDYRFAKLNIRSEMSKDDLYAAIQMHLSSAEDKITSCIILNSENKMMYATGEKILIDEIIKQLPQLDPINRQLVMEFKLDDETRSLGIITPVHDENNVYLGSMVSIYEKTYLFKIISSYYNVADTSTYIVREAGDVINYRGTSDDSQDVNISEALKDMSFEKEGTIDNVNVSGYYRKISNTPWYLAGFLDDQIIADFTNQFIWAYILIVIILFSIDIILAFYFTNKVVKPINDLIYVMDQYQNNLYKDEIPYHGENGYFETKYLRTKFADLMNTILSVQHNFEGVYQLYQSADMSDINIDIDVIKQTIGSNKIEFEQLIKDVDDGIDECIVEKFTKCFDTMGQAKLQKMFENMRDEHLSVPCETELHMPHFQQKWFHTVVVPMYANDRLSRLFIQLRDISTFKLQEIVSNEQARRDDLTNLYNRQGFIDLVRSYLQKEEGNATHAVLFIDMDYFKLVNDNFGHQEGDQVLRKVSEALLDIIKEKGLVARFGGDEFVIFLPGCEEAKIYEIEKSIHERLQYSYEKDNISFTVSASIGISTWNDASQSPIESILKLADTRMYEAKRKLKEANKR